MHQRQALALLTLMVVCSRASAQGTASYGGIAEPIVEAVLIGLLIVAVVVLLLVRWVYGNVAALKTLGGMVAGLTLLFVYANLADARRKYAYSLVEHEYAVGCANATRTINRAAEGHEPVYIRLKGAAEVPEHLRFDVLPSSFGVGHGVTVGEPPADAKNAVVVDMAYRREPIPGSYSGAQWWRLQYEAKVTRFPGGEAIASTQDAQARNGYCLGSLEAFLSKALHRDSVLMPPQTWKSSSPSVPTPDVYVGGTYGPAVKGEFKPARWQQGEDVKALLASQSCTVKESSISPMVATCGTAGVEIEMAHVIKIQRWQNSWLIIHNIFKGMRAPTSLRIEQRSSDWQLVRVWESNFVPLAGQGEDSVLDAVSAEHDAMGIDVLWDPIYSKDPPWSPSYARKAKLTIPLPGLGVG